MSAPVARAIPVERGCGFRSPGGVYVECGVGEHGTPFETFLLDPPHPLPDGLDLANKAQLWDDAEHGVTHLLIWVGEAFYRYVSDFIEESKRYGVSRKLSPYLDVSRLSQQSRMLLAHPKAFNARWHHMTQPDTCAKLVPGHAQGDGQDVAGPCLFKTYDLIPRDAALDPEEGITLDGRTYYTRTIGSTDYLFAPTGEPSDGLLPGIFAALPITGFALIKRDDGSVNQRAEDALRRAGLPYYHAEE
jgi:hypothetical protein